MTAESMSWIPADIDLNQPNAARVYDYYLGGANNFDADREFGRNVLRVVPDGRIVVQENRSFLRRAVTFLTRAGIRQFIDLGSGIPTVRNTHEIAQKVAADARVAYVDNEPVAVAHSELLLQDNPNTAVVRADIRRPDDVLRHPAVRQLIDFDQPVAVLMFAVLHFVTDGPAGLVARYRDATAAGSYVAISHATADNRPDLDDAAGFYRLATSPAVPRGYREVADLFAGYELISPGLVFTSQWRPELDIEHPERSGFYAGVGRRR